jgi:hypothetical protein
MAKTATSTKRAPSRAELRTMKDIRDYILGVLEGSDEPLTQYEVGFQASFDDLARVLDPEGEDYDRPIEAIVASLHQEVRAEDSKARLQTVKAVREHLDEFFMDLKKSPANCRYLYGREDGYRHVWTMVDPMGFEAAAAQIPEIIPGFV